MCQQFIVEKEREARLDLSTDRCKLLYLKCNWNRMELIEITPVPVHKWIITKFPLSTWNCLNVIHWRHRYISFAFISTKRFIQTLYLHNCIVYAIKLRMVSSSTHTSIRSCIFKRCGSRFERKTTTTKNNDHIDQCQTHIFTIRFLFCFESPKWISKQTQRILWK